MSNFVPEIASVLGALDDAAFADGQPANAYVRRTMAMQANRLRSMGHPLISMAWDVDTSASEPAGQFVTYAPPQWIQALPGPIPLMKKPGLGRADARLVAKVSDDHVVFLQLVTNAHPFDGRAQTGDPNVITCTADGDNDFDLYSLDVADGLLLREGDLEALSVMIRAEPTTSLANTGTFGAPNTAALTGTNDYVRTTYVRDVSATWKTLPLATLSAGGHAVYFTDGAGSIIVGHRWIIDVPVRDRIYFWPPLTEHERRLVTRSTYFIVRVPELRFGGLTVSASDRGTVIP